MNNKIKKSYSNIKMTEEAKEKIYQQILQRDMGSRLEPKADSKGKKTVLSTWKIGIAACLAAALIIPTGVYAAGKLSEYMSVNIEKNNYQTKIKLHKSKNAQDTSATSAMKTKKQDMKYIQVKADFGPNYTQDMDKALHRKYNYYYHKDGFSAGKDFYYELLYMDASSDAILNLYNINSMEETEINGHRALFCEESVVQGSRYHSDYDIDYTLNVFVFYDEYGYIINYCGMQGLGKEQLISLAKKATVTEASPEDASKYELLSEFSKNATKQIDSDGPDKTEITLPVNGKNDVVEHSGLTYQVTNVKVSSQVAEYDTKNHKQAPFLEQCRGLWDKNGKLKPYIREGIKYGNGVSEAEISVAGEESIQPKMVYVTMKVKATKEGETFQLPSIDFFEKEGQKYYDTRRYQQYNRPDEIEFALVDYMPCYFKETNGGKGYWLKDMKKGEEQVFHFAYMVDEDMTDSMYLCLDNGEATSQSMNYPYIDISQ